MSLSLQNSMVETHETICYRLNDVLYVPHYRNGAIFVGPGYPRVTRRRYSAEELLARGAVPVTEMMWSRDANGIVNERNP